MIARARRLDGGIERQKACLVGYVSHRAHDLANALGLLLQAADDLDRPQLALGISVHRDDRQIDLLGSLGQQGLET